MSSAQALSTFLSGLAGEAADGFWAVGSRRAAIQDASLFLTNGLFRHRIVEMETEYGAVIVATANGRNHKEVSEYQLLVLGLDGWRFTSSGGRAAAIAHSEPSVLHIGTIACESLHAIKSRYAMARAVMRTRQDGQRNASNEHGGHQKTPSCIAALAEWVIARLHLSDSAFKNVCNVNDLKLSPRGGFTDVGLHTGGEARDTEEPLIMSLLHFALFSAEPELELPGLVFERALGEYRLCVVSRALDALRDAASKTVPLSPAALDAFVLPIADAVRRFARIAETSLDDVAHLLHKFESMRAQFDAIIAENGRCVAASYSLIAPSVSAVLALKSPQLKISEVPAASSTVNVSRERLVKLFNANFCPHVLIPPSETKPFATCKIWMEKYYSGTSEPSKILTLTAEFESLLFHRIKSLPLCPADDAKGPMEWSEVEALLWCTEQYRKLSAVLRSTKSMFDKGGLSLVNIRSRCVLVVWSAFVLLHHAVHVKEPLIGQFSIALRTDVAGLLVLSDCTATEALARVVGYISRFQTGPEIFSYRTNEFHGTLELARRYSASNTSLCNIAQQETATAEERSDNWWKDVLQRRVEHNNLAKQLEEAYAPETCDRYNYKIRQSIKSRINAYRKSLLQIKQPIPKSPLTYLFFCYMPFTFQSLARWSFECYDVLAEMGTPATSCSALNMKCVVEYYNNCLVHNKRGNDTQNCGALKFVMRQEPGYHNFDVFIATESDAHWYPPTDPIGYQWSRDLNCDDLTPSGLAEAFTERLLDSPNLQAAMKIVVYGPDILDRNNIYIAQQDLRPGWLTKPEYLAFTSIRSAPLMQIRKICVELRDSLLPLTQEDVHRLLRQAIFHVGPVSTSFAANGEANAGNLLWKTDLFVNGDLASEGDAMDELAEALEQLSIKLSDAVSLHAALRILGELCAYFGGFSGPAAMKCRRLARKVSRIACNWVDGIEPEIALAESTGDVSRKAMLQAQVNTFCGYTIIAYGFDGELTVDDAMHLVTLRVRWYKSEPLNDRTSAWTALAFVVDGIMARRTREMIGHITSDCLTSAGRFVLPELPDGLQWSKIFNEQCGCYETTLPSGDNVSLNIHKGIVLFNGEEPTKLPQSYIDDALYKRVFGSRNCAIVPKGNGVLRTASPVVNRYYEFALIYSKLMIYEEAHMDLGDVKQTIRLRLLDSASPTGLDSWGLSLPARLKTLHSHWLAEDVDLGSVCDGWRGDLLLFRGIKFSNRSIHFIGIRQRNEALGEWKIYRAIDPTLPLSVLAPLAVANKLDRLVCLDAACTTALRPITKFESLNFIHCYITPIGTYLLDLLRYNLRFEMHESGGKTHLHSLDYAGFVLAPEQQLLNTLPGFTRYLLLAPAGRNRLDSTRDTVRLITPQLKIIGTGLEIPTNPEANISCFTYRMHHRFSILIAPDIASRLHLAALYVATSSHAVDQGVGMTGYDFALDLVRQSWINQPLSPLAEKALRQTYEFAKARAPSVALLCAELSESSRSLAKEDQNSITSLLSTKLVATEYTLRNRLCPCNHRSQLTMEEEERCLGYRPYRSNYLSWDGSLVGNRLTTYTRNLDVSITSLVAAKTAIGFSDTVLKALVCDSQAGTNEVTFPFERTGVLTTAIGAKMMDDLETSWAQFFTLETPVINYADATCAQICEIQLKLISKARSDLESELISTIASVPCSKDLAADLSIDQAISFCLLRAGGYSCTPNIRDLLRASWDPESLRSFNPFLSPAALSKLRGAVLLWMELCVLEDRVSRILGYSEMALKSAAIGTANGASDAKAARELAVREIFIHREWDPSENPQWLVFEVEGGLQIRPEQYAIIKMVLETPGTISQLNMGLGKTRVIVPCLLLHLANGQTCTVSEANLVRLYLLPELLDEAFAFLHSALCASICNRKVFRIPFNRDTVINDKSVCAIIRTLRHCQRVGGVLILGPQERLSFLLKWHELELAGRICPDTEPYNARMRSHLESIDAFPFVDIFDESDALLSQRRQLIYSVGSKGPLEMGEHRWEVIQAVLQACRYDPSVLEVLRQPGVASMSNEAAPFEFHRLFLLPGEKLVAAWPESSRRILQAVLQKPPRALEWIKLVSDSALQHLTNIIMDPSYVSDAIIDQLAPNRCAHILMLRGLFAHNLLFTTLQRRHNVNFGVSRGAWQRKKRLAVPFVAAATPSLRSEFNQVDCSLMFTTLSYYSDGLSRNELLETFRLLLGIGLTAQSVIYGSWFKLSATDAPTDEATVEKLHSINEIAKVDLGNALQFEVLFTYFARNVLVIDYWLNNIVFPVDTAVLPQRLWATPWDLADGAKQQMGFSGTKDAALLLPLSVTQRAAPMPSIGATDGRMLAKLANDASYFSLPIEASNSLPTAVFDLALSKGYSALIDTGALMAGMSNEHVADLVLERAASLDVTQHKAIVYFDATRREWVAKDARWGRILPLHSSPISAADSFVFFDEARTRGADIKMRHNAVAALTLCPKLCKDALMQGAGRMRSLDFGQRVVLVAPAVVDDMVRLVAGVSATAIVAPVDVIRYVTENTVAWVGSKLTEWASQGGHFLETRGSRQLRGVARGALLDERTDLPFLYAGDDSEISVANQVSRSIEKVQQRRAAVLLADSASNAETTSDSDEIDVARRLTEYAKALGEDVFCRIRANASEMECECEVALEIEVERGMEREIKRCAPAKERSWKLPVNFDKFQNVSTFVAGVGLAVSSLASVIKSVLPNLSGLDWSKQKVFVSNNALEALAVGAVGGRYADASYLQAVDAALVFPTTGEVLVLSDLETQRVIEGFWALEQGKTSAHPKAYKSVVLCHLAYLRSFAGAGASQASSVPLSLPRGSEVGSAVSDDTLAALQLFAGEVQFRDPARIAAIRGMFPDKASLGAMRDCSYYRGTAAQFSRSDLDDVRIELTNAYDPPELLGGA